MPKSSDIVFIVEAKECNQDIRRRRNIDKLIFQIQKELKDKEIVENRWALVIFGGSGIFDKPRSVTFGNQIFTKNITLFTNFFEYISAGNGDEDIFEAIRFSTQLSFRAGVSKTFILLPCSNCEAKKQTVSKETKYFKLKEVV